MLIFISHVSEESPLAVVLKEWIESTFIGLCKVFVSSDQRDIPAGSKWLNEIDQALDGARVMLLLSSPTSISRPWVNFEAGCGWIKRIPIVPICHSGQVKATLPAPIAEFQALDMESSSFVSDLFKSLATHLEIPTVPRLDQAEMRRELQIAIGLIARETPPLDAVLATTPVDETSIRILKAVAGHGVDGFTANQLAPGFQMTTQKMQYYLDTLGDAKLLFRHFIMGRPSRYTLTKGGRKMLVEKGIL